MKKNNKKKKPFWSIVAFLAVMVMIAGFRTGNSAAVCYSGIILFIALCVFMDNLLTFCLEYLKNKPTDS